MMNLKRRVVIALFNFTLVFALNSQIAVNTSGLPPNDAAMLDVKSTSKGMLIPRMTGNQRQNISNPGTGLLVYDTSTKSFWFHNGMQWKEQLIRPHGTPSEISDHDGDTSIDLEFLPDEDAIRFTFSNNQKYRLSRKQSKSGILQVLNASLTSIGDESGDKLSSSNNSSVFGYKAANGAIGAGVFLGANSGKNNTNIGQTIIGNLAGSTGVTGEKNLFVGSGAGLQTTSGISNIYLGYKAGRNNISGDHNVYLGNKAGRDFTGNNKLVISNDERLDPLVLGDFAGSVLQINGTTNLGEKLIVSGNLIQYYESASNDAGIIIKDSGNVGINEFNPEERLSVRGNVKVENDLSFGTSKDLWMLGSDDTKFLHLIAGRIESDGSLSSSYSATDHVLSSTRTDEGKYTIDIEFSNDSNGEFYSQRPTVIITSFHGSGENRYGVVESVTNKQAKIMIRNASGDRKNAAFNFIIVGKKN